MISGLFLHPSKNYKRIFIPPVFALFLFEFCSFFPLGSHLDFCDHYEENGCAELQPQKRTYEIRVRDSKKNTWYDFGYEMYFHTRQTPGIYVDFTRSLTEEEFKKFKESIQCSYRLYKDKEQEVSGHMEGMKINPDRSGFWCFDYLGSMLVAYHKRYGSIQEKPDEDFFPVFLEISYDSSLEEVRGSGTAEIQVKW
ncbi:MAG: hypothetical protein OEZ34_16005 [Spirochaetia bacterium]|nr:hypothetical protein [Spirochaetia bacterium]